ncbi:ImmA/IrrE family metallo-endopeptidase, partial [bacterium]|nr:ImmA/IrrE family metallo-endopeptidase [bacterium]
MNNNKNSLNIKIGIRIRMEREKMGLTLQKLARKAGYNNYQTLLSIEKGERQITMDDLMRISKALSLSIDYLMTEPEEKTEIAIWRKCNNPEKCKEYENLLKKYCYFFKNINKLLKIDYELFEPLSNTYFRSINLSNYYKFAQKLADKIREDYNLGEFPAGNIIETLQEKNILIFYFDLKKYGSAASLVGNFGGAILLNRNDKVWRGFFDIAHELFHLLTWNMFDVSEIYDDKRGKSNVEKYADAFASHLLVPNEVFKKVTKRYKNEIGAVEVLELSLQFRVSLNAMLYKLENLKKIDKTKAEEWRNNIKLKNAYKESFEEKYRNEIYTKEFPENYMMPVIKAYLKNAISKMRMAEYFGKNIGEIDYYLKMNRYDTL